MDNHPWFIHESWMIHGWSCHESLHEHSKISMDHGWIMDDYPWHMDESWMIIHDTWMNHGWLSMTHGWSMDDNPWHMDDPWMKIREQLWEKDGFKIKDAIEDEWERVGSKSRPISATHLILESIFFSFLSNI